MISGSAAHTDNETASPEIIPSLQDQELLPLNPNYAFSGICWTRQHLWLPAFPLPG